MSKQTLYLGGPMTGRPQFNFPAFDRAAAKLREHGYGIVSPAELDDPETREAALASADGAPGTGSHSGQTWADFLARDVKLIADKVDGIVLLDGWEKSKGARLECFVARLDGKPIYLYRPDSPGLKIDLPAEAMSEAFTANGVVPEALFEQPEDLMTPQQILAGTDSPEDFAARVKTTEIRKVDPNTGGEKGQKIRRYDLIPAYPQDQDALVYGAGAQKYDDDNWRRGFSWRLSLGALRRHLALWQSGEKYDAELTELAGEPVTHLACVRWHAATLMVFDEEGLGTDDIPERSRS
jgi:hypothetical protein